MEGGLIHGRITSIQTWQGVMRKLVELKIFIIQKSRNPPFENLMNTQHSSLLRSINRNFCLNPSCFKTGMNMKNIKENIQMKTLTYQKLLVFLCLNNWKVKATGILKNIFKITGKRKHLMISSENKKILKFFIPMSLQL